MADIFAGIWLKTSRHIRSAGTSLLLAKVSGDAAYYALGASRDVNISVSSLGKEDSLQRMQGWGHKVSAIIPSLQASKTEIQILPQLLLNDPVAVAITETDGGVLKDDGTKLGLRWTLEYGGRSEDFRHIKYELGGYLFGDEPDNLFTNTAVTLGTPGSADKLFTLAQTNVLANQVPNGLTKFEFKAAADAAYADFGEMEDAKISFICEGPYSGGARQIPRTIAIHFKATITGLQTALTEKALLKQIRKNEIDIKMTHADGVVFSGNHTSFGTQPIYKNAGISNKWNTVDLEIGGTILKDVTGLIYQDQAAASWASLWV